MSYSSAWFCREKYFGCIAIQLEREEITLTLFGVGASKGVLKKLVILQTSIK